jgi:sigma-B regulation protein RsbU (phosphoserine phosphatase)
VRVLAEESVPQIADLMARLNRCTTANCPDNRFISFFFSVLDPNTGELVYSNAGHNPPLLVRSNGNVERLETGGMLLGIFNNATYNEGRCRLDPSDILLIFSDGVTEATNPAGDEFDEPRLIEVLRANREAPAAGVLQAVKTAVTGWLSGGHFADDLTMVAAKRVG